MDALAFSPPPSAVEPPAEPTPDPLAGWPAGVWRADRLGVAAPRVWPSGWPALDAVLPGGGWPGHALTELLAPHSTAVLARLLAPCWRGLRRPLAFVAPPHPPHAPGLCAEGLPPARLLWLAPHTPAERLWTTEQLIRANACGAVIAWLPQASAAQLRRLQVLAAGCEGPVFVCRPLTAQHDASPAPLRLRLRAAEPGALSVEVLKRPGPPVAAPLRLAAWPAALAPLLPARLRTPAVMPAVVPAVVSPTVSPPAPNRRPTPVAGVPAELPDHAAVVRPANPRVAVAG